MAVHSFYVRCITYRIITYVMERVTTTQYRATDLVKAQTFTCAIQVTSAIGIGITVIPKNIVMTLQMKAEHAKLGKSFGTFYPLAFERNEL